MNYAIARIAKIKSWAKVKSAQSHNLRERPVLNADPRGSIMLAYGSQDLIGALKRRFEAFGIGQKRKIRKDAVLCSEMVLTGSNEHMGEVDIEKWVKANVAWLKRQYGDNLLQAVVHMDETTPHIHAMVSPICEDGKLSCKRFWGGPAGFRKFQDDYAKAMKPLGFKRGVRGSVARHQSLKRFYGAMDGFNLLPSWKRFPKRPHTEQKTKGWGRGIDPDTVIRDLRQYRKEVRAWCKEVYATAEADKRSLAVLKKDIQRKQEEINRLAKIRHLLNLLWKYARTDLNKIIEVAKKRKEENAKNERKRTLRNNNDSARRQVREFPKFTPKM